MRERKKVSITHANPWNRTAAAMYEKKKKIRDTKNEQFTQVSLTEHTSIGAFFFYGVPIGGKNERKVREKTGTDSRTDGASKS